MILEFSAPLADARNYPPVTVKGLPTQRLLAKSVQPKLLAKNVHNRLLLDSARSGLYMLALSMETEVVWAPAYHCPALVEPFLAANKQIKFYPQTEKLLPDYNFLQQQHAKKEAIIGIRYFGFDCGMADLKTFCDNRSSILIEDLAHAAFFKNLIGHAAVTSLVKFYPMQSGAELLISDEWPTQSSLNESYELLPCIIREKIRFFTRKLLRKLRLVSGSPKYRYFNFLNISRHLSNSDLAVLNTSDYQHIIDKRRSNYQCMVEYLNHSPLGRALYPEIDTESVPYVLPFLLYDEASFDLIRNNGIQIYRWEELAKSDCLVCKKFRKRLIQIPCHQDITQQDIEFMMQVFNQ